jgi:uncharacterized protein (DUF2252 family)
LAWPNGSWLADDDLDAARSTPSDAARPATSGAGVDGTGRAWGRSLRRVAPRRSHAEFEPSERRPDPVDLLQSANEGRVAELVPIRFGRMSASPFGFFRGAAALMADDLGGTPVSGIEVQLCGDAHLSNFGLYATPERRLVFGVNDFDETMRGPWEWDVKRLAASLVVAARDIGLTGREREAAAIAAACSYREHMGIYAEMGLLELWYATVDVAAMLPLLRAIRARARRTADRAVQRDHLRALHKLTEVVGDTRRIRHAPPLVMRVDDQEAVLAQLGALITEYRTTLPEERRVLFDRYRVTDVAMKVVGVGSVGTHCWIGLLHGQGNGPNDPLFLQVKEARPSVLESQLGPSRYGHHGQRVVVGQRLMQAFPDVLLGWTSAADSGRHYYVRQLQDMKGSFTVDGMEGAELASYGALCGWTLARSHARSSDAPAIAGYLGSSPRFDRAIGAFAGSYADQNERDYEAFTGAIADGRLTVRTGV